MARRRKGPTPTIEWLGGAIGLAIVLGTIGFLAFETFRDHPNEATLDVTVVRVRDQGGSFAVDVDVRNSGRAAAADVHIAATARLHDGREARPEARVDHVPGLSVRRVTLVFPSHPGERPDVRVTGFSKP